MKIYKNGVYAGHMTPVHNGHLQVIQCMLDECERSHIVLLADKKLALTEKCEELLKRVIRPVILQEYIHVITLPDLFKEEFWQYLYYNMCSVIKDDGFSFYYSGNKDRVENNIPSNIKKRIMLRNVNQYNDITDEKVKTALLEGDYYYIEEVCPKPVSLAKGSLTELLRCKCVK